MTSKKLLIADDSLTIQKVIKLALSNEDYEIQAVSDGKDVEEKIAIFQPDLLLIDHSLPSKNAYELKEAYDRDRDPDHQVHFVLMSSAYEEIPQEKIDKMNFSGHLIKPFDPSNLRDILNSAYASQDSATSDPLPPPRFSEEPPELPNVDVNAIETTDEPSVTNAAQFLTPTELPKEEGESPISNDQLWETDEKIPLPKMSFEEAEKEYVSEEPPLEEIQQLTQATIDLSEELAEKAEDPVENEITNIENQWSIGQTSLDPDDQDFDINSVDVSTEVTATHEPRISPPTNALDHGGNTLDLTPPAPPKETGASGPTPPPPPAMPSFEYKPEGEVPAPGTKTTSAPTGAGTSPEVVGISSEEMETLIQKQLQQTIKKMVGDALPDIAEKIIKEEIHRMLSDPPRGL